MGYCGVLEVLCVISNTLFNQQGAKPLHSLNRLLSRTMATADNTADSERQCYYEIEVHN